MNSEWKEKDRKSYDGGTVWQRKLQADGKVYGHVSQYMGSEMCCWQAVRGELRVSGTSDNEMLAKGKADEILALPVSEFRQLVLVDLNEDMQEVIEKIKLCSPDSLTPYQAGYQAGLLDAKERVLAAFGTA